MLCPQECDGENQSWGEEIEEGLKVLVTGAAGHIGNNVVRALLESGHSPIPMVRSDQTALDGLPVEIRRGDLLDPASLSACVEGVDAVIHAAAYVGLKASEQDQMERVNIQGTRGLLNACEKASVARFVHFSSVHALSQTPFEAPLTETNALALKPEAHPYDRTKAEAERCVLEAAEQGLSVAIVSPTAVLGPHDFKPSRLGQVLWALYAGKMPALVKSGFDFVDVRDVSMGAVKAMESDCRGERYLLTGKWHSFRELAESVERVPEARPAPGWDAPVFLASIGAPFAEFGSWLTGKPPLFSRGALHMLVHQNPQVDGAKARERLGYSSRPLEETVEDTLEWWRGNQ